MMNTELIARTVKIVSDYYEGEGIYETNENIEKVAKEWYNNTEITNPITLAAVTMTGHFRPGITFDKIRKIEEFFFFPIVPIEYQGYPHISELEECW